MKINQNKIENPAALPIESVEVINDNNFSFTFYNYGGYIHEVNIPYLNREDITEDVLLGYGDVDVSVDGFGSASDSGYNARLGFRGMVSSNFEMGGYVSDSDVIELTDLTVEGRYHFNESFSMAIEIGNDEELEDHYGLNFRFNF